MKPWAYTPARDLGLGRHERLCSYERETDLCASALRWAWGLSLRQFFRIWNGLEVQGGAHLPPAPPLVLAANHASHLDALVLAAALPLAWRDQTSPIGAADYFFTTPGRAWFSATVLNALPLWRARRLGHAHQLEALRQKLLTDRAVYILFPEGTRTRDGQIHAFKPGLGRLVAGTEVPVVPCFIQGTREALAPGQMTVRATRLSVRIGAPLRFGSVTDEVGGWKGIAAAVQSAVLELN